MLTTILTTLFAVLAFVASVVGFRQQNKPHAAALLVSAVATLAALLPHAQTINSLLDEHLMGAMSRLDPNSPLLAWLTGQFLAIVGLHLLVVIAVGSGYTYWRAGAARAFSA